MSERELKKVDVALDVLKYQGQIGADLHKAAVKVLEDFLNPKVQPKTKAPEPMTASMTAPIPHEFR